MSKNRRFFVAAVVFTAFSLGMSASGAATQGRGRGQASKPEKIEKTEKAAKKDGKSEAFVVDRDGYVRVIREYGRGGSRTPRLAKRQPLPPGLRSQLRERGELPPGLQQHLMAVPAPLITRLPPVPAYYQRYFGGDDLIVVDTRTNRVVAIVRDVWR